jgi:hypothetical protein
MQAQADFCRIAAGVRLAFVRHVLGPDHSPIAPGPHYQEVARILMYVILVQSGKYGVALFACLVKGSCMGLYPSHIAELSNDGVVAEVDGTALSIQGQREGGKRAI